MPGSGILIALSIICSFWFSSDNSGLARSPKESTFSKLEAIRSKKKQQVIAYLSQQKNDG
jgi:hypothetical protein